MKQTLSSAIVVLLVITVVMVVHGHAGQLPDTGQSKCYDANGNVLDPCPQPGEPFYGQDAQYQRPRSYTKLDAGGNALSDSAAAWVMVRDNVTGLIWEVKTDDGSIHDKDNTYTWYDSNPATNGGDAGTPGAGTDTEDFINALNSGSGYCGHTDWRLPTVKELSSLTDSGRVSPGIDMTYFKWTQSSNYWSSTTNAYSTYYAWLVYFGYGDVYYGYKSNNYYVRAVRSGP